MIKAQIYPAIILTGWFAICMGLAFPLVVWVLGQIVFPFQANGSLIEDNGKVIGSELIGQSFSSPKYFHSRPSAAGLGYDPLGSSGTNLGPISAKLFSGIPDDPQTLEIDESYLGVVGLAKEYRKLNGLEARHPVPVDAVTRSGSGLDPHISLGNAELQIVRVAKARALNVDQVRVLVNRASEGRFLGIFGESRVNVLKLNLMLDRVGNT